MSQNDNPFMNAFNQNQFVDTGNPVLNARINSPEGQEAMVKVQQMMQQMHMGPQQLFMTLLQRGQFSQERINNAVQMTNSFFGKKY